MSPTDRGAFAALLIAAAGTESSPCFAADSASAVLAEVIVSARKRDENLQRVPISVSALPGEELAQSNATRVQDILRSLPNVSTDIQQPRLASVVIRGLGRNPANDGLESSVGVFVDGVYLGRTAMVVTDFIDLERLEVLRGPQGTLFGKNATAGALNLVTHAPSWEPQASVELTGGSHDLRQVKAAISGPVVRDELAFRLNVFSTERRGFTKDTVLDMHLMELNRFGTRGQLLWQPREQASVRLIADYSSLDEAGPGFLLVDPQLYLIDGSVRPNNFVERAARSGYVPQFNPRARRTDAEAEQRSTSEQGGVSMQLDWPISQATLTSVSAWRKWNFRPRNDGDGTALAVQPVLGSDARYSQASQELRLISPAGRSFEWVAGAYFFHQGLESNAVTVFGPDAASFLQAGLPAYVLDGFEVRTLADPQTDSYAAFGQFDWRPNDHLELTTGLRWTTESRHAHIERTSYGGVSVPPTDILALSTRARFGSPVQTEVTTDEEFLSGLLSLAWHTSEGTMFYASASRGAKSGGINVAVVPAGTPQTIEPEVAMSYELGVKTQWPAQRLRISSSVYSTSVRDYQATVRDRIRGSNYLTNAGSVRSQGVELEAQYRPLSSLSVNLAAGWNDARYTSFRSAPCPPELSNQSICDFTGRRIFGAPPWNASGALVYEVPVGTLGLQLFTGVEYTHSAAYPSDSSMHTLIPAYNVTNLRFGLRASDDHWALTLWARNLFDKDYYTTLSSGGSFNSGVAFGLLGEPRTVGISFRMQL